MVAKVVVFRVKTSCDWRLERLSNHLDNEPNFNHLFIKISERENYFRSGQLSRYLSVKNRIYVLGLGIPDCVDWPVELGFFILNISMSDAKYIGNKFQQNAILWFRPMSSITLVWLVESKLSGENF